MTSFSNPYRNIVEGEINIIHEEIENFNKNHQTTNQDAFNFLECVNPHLMSIEQKIGKNSTEYINISTRIVDTICNKFLIFTNLSSDNIINNLSDSDIVKFYAKEKEKLVNALRICQKLEKMNIDYEYRIKIFNKTKDNIEKACQEKGIETRTSIQKNIDNLKTIGSVTGEAALHTAGCLASLAIKIVIVLLIFLALMAIFGVER